MIVMHTVKVDLNLRIYLNFSKKCITIIFPIVSISLSQQNTELFKVADR